MPLPSKKTYPAFHDLQQAGYPCTVVGEDTVAVNRTTGGPWVLLTRLDEIDAWCVTWPFGMLSTEKFYADTPELVAAMHRAACGVFCSDWREVLSALEQLRQGEEPLETDEGNKLRTVAGWPEEKRG